MGASARPVKVSGFSPSGISLGLGVAKLSPSDQAPLCHAQGRAGCHDHMIQDTHINQG